MQYNRGSVRAPTIEHPCVQETERDYRTGDTERTRPWPAQARDEELGTWLWTRVRGHGLRGKEGRGARRRPQRWPRKKRSSDI